MSRPDVPLVKRALSDRDSATAIGPKYVNVNAFWQDMVDAASDYNSPILERFQNEPVLIVPATMATQGLPIMIPANRQDEDEELNADWGATANFVFALINEKPNSEKTRMTVVAYWQSVLSASFSQKNQNHLFLMGSLLLLLAVIQRVWTTQGEIILQPFLPSLFR